MGTLANLIQHIKIPNSWVWSRFFSCSLCCEFRLKKPDLPKHTHKCLPFTPTPLGGKNLWTARVRWEMYTVFVYMSRYKVVRGTKQCLSPPCTWHGGERQKIINSWVCLIITIIKMESGTIAWRIASTIIDVRSCNYSSSLQLTLHCCPNWPVSKTLYRPPRHTHDS